jgi:hypothetical protein
MWLHIISQQKRLVQLLRSWPFKVENEGFKSSHLQPKKGQKLRTYLLKNLIDIGMELVCGFPIFFSLGTIYHKMV